MNKWLRISLKIAIPIFILAGGVYAYGYVTLEREKDKVWDEVLAYESEYAKTHPEVSKEDLDIYSQVRYFRLLKERHLQ